MAEPYVGEIRMVGFNFAPKGWALCNGQLLPIIQNQALFTLLGTTYGGDGQSTFALPDLRGRVAIHMGQGAGLSNRSEGETGGAEEVTLIPAQMPAHTHTAMGTNAPANQRGPAGGVPALEATGQTATYSGAAANAAMGPSAISVTGGGQHHENMPPFLTINFVIALVGIFPSQN